MMADERKMVEEAYAGDIIGIFDPGIFYRGHPHDGKGQVSV